jgi:hypothetical protein
MSADCGRWRERSSGLTSNSDKQCYFYHFNRTAMIVIFLYFLEVPFPCTFQTRTDQQKMIYVLISCFTECTDGGDIFVVSWFYIVKSHQNIYWHARCKADQLEKKSLKYLQIQDRPISKPHNSILFINVWSFSLRIASWRIRILYSTVVLFLIMLISSESIFRSIIMYIGTAPIST